MVDYLFHYIWGEVQVCYPNGAERICEWVKPEAHPIVVPEAHPIVVSDFSGFGWVLWVFVIIIIFMIIGLYFTHNESQDEREAHEIQSLRDSIRLEQIRLLEGMGRPGQKDGDYTPAQKATWDRIKILEERDAAIVAKTQVKNIEPLGHNIERVWISKRNPLQSDDDNGKRRRRGE